MRVDSDAGVWVKTLLGATAGPPVQTNQKVGNNTRLTPAGGYVSMGGGDQCWGEGEDRGGETETKTGGESLNLSLSV